MDDSDTGNDTIAKYPIRGLRGFSWASNSFS